MKHWTTWSTDDALFSMVYDIMDQVATRRKALKIGHKRIAQRLGYDVLHLKQMLDTETSATFTFKTMLNLLKVLGLTATVVTYRLDPQKGPINSEVFQSCWKAMGCPHDMGEVQDFLEHHVGHSIIKTER